jgi:hypothetical protein
MKSYLTLPRMRKLLDDSTSPKKKILHTSDFNYIVYQAQALVYQAQALVYQAQTLVYQVVASWS